MSLTPEKAKEIIERQQHNYPRKKYHENCPNRSCVEATAFLEGYSYREKEIEELVGALENIKNELGKPNPRYAAPISNAYFLAIEALGKFQKGNMMNE